MEVNYILLVMNKLIVVYWENVIYLLDEMVLRSFNYFRKNSSLKEDVKWKYIFLVGLVEKKLKTQKTCIVLTSWV